MTKQPARTVFNTYGAEIDFDAAVNIMDDEIRELIHDRLAPCADQEFFDAYCLEHAGKFAEEFEPAKSSPVW